MTLYPFAALVGQDSLRLALTLLAVEPRLGGLLIQGHKGTAKSTAARGFAELMPRKAFVNVPLSVSEDRLLGSLDLQEALQGRQAYQPGLVGQAHEGVLYIDEVNLLAEHLSDAVLDVAASGWLQLEREGLSLGQAARFMLVASMNREEGELRPQLLDRFGLCVETVGLPFLDDRSEIVRRRLAFESDGAAFRKLYHRDQQRQQENILRARQHLNSVEVPERIVTLAVDRALAAGVQGHRADLLLVKAARAQAALLGRPTVQEDHLDAVAPLVLAHRQKTTSATPPESRAGSEPESQSQEPSRGHSDRGETAPKPGPSGQQSEQTPSPPPDEDRPSQGPAPPEVIAPTAPFPLESWLPKPVARSSRRGRGGPNKASARTGRQVSAASADRVPPPRDLALAATLRAACLRGGSPLPLRREDLRFKVRRARVGTTVFFLVDASGSMAARRRMAVTKGAVLSLLLESYRRRDRVALAIFCGSGAEVRLTPTRSVDVARRLLTDLPTGGRSPLAHGLTLASQELAKLRQRDPASHLMLVLVSDGRANGASPASTDPRTQALQIAAGIFRQDVPSLALDSEQGPVLLGQMRSLAQALGATYRRLDQLQGAEIAGLIKHQRNLST